MKQKQKNMKLKNISYKYGCISTLHCNKVSKKGQKL